MIAAFALVAGLLAGFAAGGSIGGIGKLNLRGEVLVIVAFLVQGVARGRLAGAAATSWGTVIWLGSSVLLVFLLVLNLRTPGALVGATGTLLNVLVVLANGAMPVVPRLGTTDEVLKATIGSHGFYAITQPWMLAQWAGDALPLSLLGQTYYLSVGDVLLGVGAAVLLAGAMIAPGDLD